MSDSPATGVLYTNHSDLRAQTVLASVWSYETCARRASVAVNADGNHEYWLDRSDPLLNTILPGTAVSIVINTGDQWSAGRSLATSALIPRVAVFGPFIRPRVLHVGKHVDTIGLVLPSPLAASILGVPPSALVEQIVPLGDLWGRSHVARIMATMIDLPARQRLSLLIAEATSRIAMPARADGLWFHAPAVIQKRRGNISIDAWAKHEGISRRHFARRFGASTGLPPKLFARLTRFQSTVFAMLATDVSQWIDISIDLGFYDQAHMINEFREFAGRSPTRFFRPHDDAIDPGRVRVQGKPSEWLRA